MLKSTKFLIIAIKIWETGSLHISRVINGRDLYWIISFITIQDLNPSSWFSATFCFSL